MNINHINTLCIIISAVVAYIVPFELLLFSYAVFGPAHYLTQIAWMHERSFFCRVDPNQVVYVFGAITLLILLGSIQAELAIFCALVYALYLVLPKSLTLSICTFFFGAALFILFLRYVPDLLIFLGIMLPTVIHVFVFTAAFMIVGALRNRSVDAWIALVALVVCSISFFILPVNFYPLSEYVQNNAWFEPITTYLQNIFVSTDMQESRYSITGFLAFAYTYHYLNWFTKVQVIGWYGSSKKILVPILFIYILSLACYAYDYRLGLIVLFFLSYLHVLLELPLNWQTFFSIYKLATWRSSK